MEISGINIVYNNKYDNPNNRKTTESCNGNCGICEHSRYYNAEKVWCKWYKWFKYVR